MRRRLGMTILAATLNFYSNTPEVLFSDFFLYIDPLCILTQESLQRKVRDRPICSGGPLVKSLVCGEVAVLRGDRKFMQKRCIFDFETHGTLIIWTDQHFLNVKRDRTMYGMSICNGDIKTPLYHLRNHQFRIVSFDKNTRNIWRIPNWVNKHWMV